MWQICRLLLKDYAIKLAVGPDRPTIVVVVATPIPECLWVECASCAPRAPSQRPIALCVWLALVCTFVTRLRFRYERFVSNATTLGPEPPSALSPQLSALWPLTHKPAPPYHHLTACSTFCPKQALCGCAIMRCNKFYVVRVLPRIPRRSNRRRRRPRRPRFAARKRQRCQQRSFARPTFSKSVELSN